MGGLDPPIQLEMLWRAGAWGAFMNRMICIILSIAVIHANSAFAAETPPHTIAVAGEAELLLTPDFATVELGVVTQAPLVSDAVDQNGARMARVVAAVKALGIAEADIGTSTFLIEPKYVKASPTDYDSEEFRTIAGYYVTNKVTITAHNLADVAKIIDDGVKAGANASGSVTFGVDHVFERLDEARRRAVENAHHKAEVLTDAAHIQLGPAISITDNQADTSYNSSSEFGGAEEIVVTARRAATPIEPGMVRVRAVVSVLYETH